MKKFLEIISTLELVALRLGVLILLLAAVYESFGKRSACEAWAAQPSLRRNEELSRARKSRRCTSLHRATVRTSAWYRWERNRTYRDNEAVSASRLCSDLLWIEYAKL
jgi:hypothetical protein